MLTNREGQTVEVATIEKVDWYDDGGCAITRGEPEWGTFGVSAAELKGFKPQVGDVVIVYTTNMSMIHGIIIEGTVVRYRTAAEVEAEHEQWRKNWRLEKLERYVKHGEELKSRAAALPLPLRARMARFAAEAENETDFWVDDAEYEMICLEGAAALLRKVNELGFIHSSHTNFGVAEGKNDDIAGAVKWINDWWDINSDKHDPPYDYKKQMEIVPDFGDGHSGFTASAAKGLAICVLEGTPV